ncbi:MAG: NAD(P)/FAD-dependent oxidoreductase [Thermoanaerobaculia bacterium]
MKAAGPRPLRADDPVYIVGGGPAGAALALRLAQLGHTATVAERSPFDRARPGESLHPGARMLLETLGITDVPFLRVAKTLVRWSEDTDVVEHEGLAIGRPHLECFLLDRARDAGVKVLQPHATDAMPSARFIVDASGRVSWSRAPRTRTGVPTTAIAAHWRGRALPRESRIEALEDGWLWGSPLPNGSFSAMAFVDAGTDTGGARLDSMLRASQLFRDLRGQRGDVRRHDATTYACDVPWEARLLRIGEASFSLDPLSASGVLAALQSALHACAALHTVLTHPERTELAMQFVEDAQKAAVAQHKQWTAQFYARSRFGGADFYAKRAKREAAPATGNGQRATSYALAENVKIADVPCLVDDLIESRRGVVQPQARPFVWLGGREVAPLLADLERGPRSADELKSTWGAVVLDALVRSRIVVPGP